MSRSELLDAFLEGRIGRREFIQGLVAGGVALGAAAAHAAALKPAVAQPQGTVYGGGNTNNKVLNQARCIQNAAATFQVEVQQCRVNSTGTARATCLKKASDRYQTAVRKCKA